MNYFFFEKYLIVMERDDPSLSLLTMQRRSLHPLAGVLRLSNDIYWQLSKVWLKRRKDTLAGTV